MKIGLFAPKTDYEALFETASGERGTGNGAGNGSGKKIQGYNLKGAT